MSERDRQRLERADLAAISNAIWETNAAFWDQRMGGGASLRPT